MREERIVSPGKPRPRRVFAPDLEGLEQLRLLNAAPAVVAGPAPQHASSHTQISVAQEHGTGGIAVGVARGGAGFVCGGGGYAPDVTPSTLHQVPDTLLETAAATSVSLSQSGFSAINGGINLGAPNPGSVSGSGSSTMNGALNLDAVGFASGGGGYRMIAMAPAPYQGAVGNG